MMVARQEPRAATAMEHGFALVTSNTAHFSRIAGLVLECWTTP